MDGFDILDARFASMILPNAPLEKLADGFRWLEGPVWFADHGLLLRVIRFFPLRHADGMAHSVK